MEDPDFWKRQYEKTWEQSSNREEAIKSLIQTETGVMLAPKGLGAGSKEFIPGSASSHSLQKGDADFSVQGIPVNIEITGPLVTFVREDANLWIRPDKIANARSHQGVLTIVVHHLPRNNLMRVIFLNGNFFSALDSGAFPIVHPPIRGVQETYNSIPANHPVVRPWLELLDFLKKLK